MDGLGSSGGKLISVPLPFFSSPTSVVSPSFRGSQSCKKHKHSITSLEKMFEKEDTCCKYFKNKLNNNKKKTSFFTFLRVSLNFSLSSINFRFLPSNFSSICCNSLSSFFYSRDNTRNRLELNFYHPERIVIRKIS